MSDNTGLHVGSGESGDATNATTPNKSQKQLEKEAKKKAKNEEKLAKFHAKQAKMQEKQAESKNAEVKFHDLTYS